MNKKKISVLGAGSWGTALANVLADNGIQTLLWTLDKVSSDEINEKHTNEKYLPGAKINDSIQATTDLKQVIAFSEIILIVIPTQGIRSLLKDIFPILEEAKLFIHASKGLEQKTHKRISTIISEEIPEEYRKGIVALSGPSHAEEVIQKDLTSITSASQNMECAKFVQDLFMNDYFRVYTNTDIIGVELGAAIKNIIALGSGILSGLGYGDNARAALVTRGLVEIKRFGKALGADTSTFDGLSGVGDLIVTCTSIHSRNFQAGNAIGQGMSPKSILHDPEKTVEGLSTIQAAYELSQDLGIEMPITHALYKVILEDKNVEEAVINLMRREGKEE